MSPHDRIIAAAEWSERHGSAARVDTGPELRAIAARVASGDLDVSDMPPPSEGAGPWSPVLVYLEDVRGIPVIVPAHEREGSQPFFTKAAS